ncbi:MAG: hypothetical protein K2K23_02085, partial [Muribaculaceae bacterium]|nr:hypothetical protein [Muribaculaceae bacterium]
MNLKYFLACSVVCAAVTTIKAAESTDWGELQPDVVYNYDSMTPVMGKFTADAYGSIRCYSSGSEISRYM